MSLEMNERKRGRPRKSSTSLEVGMHPSLCVHIQLFHLFIKLNEKKQQKSSDFFEKKYMIDDIENPQLNYFRVKA